MSRTDSPGAIATSSVSSRFLAFSHEIISRHVSRLLNGGFLFRRSRVVWPEDQVVQSLPDGGEPAPQSASPQVNNVVKVTTNTPDDSPKLLECSHNDYETRGSQRSPSTPIQTRRHQSRPTNRRPRRHLLDRSSTTHAQIRRPTHAERMALNTPESRVERRTRATWHKHPDQPLRAHARPN